MFSLFYNHTDYLPTFPTFEMFSITADALDQVLYSPASNPSSPNSTSSEASSKSSQSLPRKSYTLRYKKDFIAKVDGIVKNNPSLSVSSVTESLGFPKNYYKRWKKHIITADVMAADPKIRSNISQETRHLHQGRTSILEPFAFPIIEKMEHIRNAGVPVSEHRVRVEANKLSDDFKNKSQGAKKAIVHRFVQRLGFS